MTLKSWWDNGWLKLHETSKNEIQNLLGIVDRDLVDAEEGISEDWRFGIAYNAALRLCTALRYAEGYKAERTLQHCRTILAMPMIMGADKKDDAIYLDVCRSKRNILEYDYIGSITKNDADELVAFVKVFKQDVLNWLNKHHPEFSGSFCKK